MKNIIMWASISFTLALTPACTSEDSTDVNQDRIYAEYEIKYDANENKTVVSAVFKFSNALGTNLELTSPSQVKFGNDILSYDATFAYYRKEYAGKINSGTFVFTNTQNQNYTNPVSLADSLSHNPIVDTISKSTAFTYNWLGSQVAANNSVSLTLVDVDNPGIFKYFLQPLVGLSNLVLGTSDLNIIPNGPTYLQLERVVEQPAPGVTSAGGKIRGVYKPLKATIEMVN